MHCNLLLGKSKDESKSSIKKNQNNGLLFLVCIINEIYMKSLWYIIFISPRFSLDGCAQRVGQNCGVKTLTKPFPEPLTTAHSTGHRY